MALRVQKGNMYGFVSHTWNTIKGKCEHDCSYCYMKKWNRLRERRFDMQELKTDLGSGNFIFVGSSCDMFSDKVSPEWIKLTLEHCSKFANKYLFQTKNPANFLKYAELFPNGTILCTTLESNRLYPEIMANSPPPVIRAESMALLNKFERHVTIEPILDFDKQEFVEMIKQISPIQVNIGADSGGHHLPEPSKQNVLALIEELKTFTTVFEKKNLRRILK